MAPRLIIALGLSALWGCSGEPRPANQDPTTKHQSPRVVSLSPAATDLIIAMGASSQLVGISRYCTAVKERPELPRLGGLLDPDLERLTLVGPDLVLLTEGNEATAKKLTALGLKTVRLRESSLAGVLDNVTELGTVMNRQLEAQHLLGRIEASISPVSNAHGLATLLVFAHDGDSIWVASPQGWLGQLAQRLGINVVPKGPKGFMQLNPEALLNLAPKQVLELRGQPAGQENKTDLQARWERLAGLPDLKGQIHVIEAPGLLKPGASLGHTAELLKPYASKRP